MGIRSKLLIPLLALGVSFAVIIYWYWLPQFHASEVIELKKRELATMEVTVAALIPSLLSGDLSQIHATLNQLMERRDGWKALRLKAADGSYIYPVFIDQSAGRDDTGNWLMFPADFEGQRLATLELNIDSDTLLASLISQVRTLVQVVLLMVLGMTIVAAIMQDRWIRRPLDALVSAASRIAHGDYKLTLPAASARDEVGSLITAFDTMRVNLAHREKEVTEQYALLDTIQAAQASFIRDTDVMSLFDKMLLDILSISGSEYGFIGEVLYRDNKPYLKTLAIKNIASDAKTRKFYEENAPTGLEFTNLDSLFGAAIKCGNTVIANNPAADPRSSGIPSGHPPLNAFLGIPFYRENKVIGMLGIANRAGGYDQALVKFISPVTATCKQIVEALKTDRQRLQAEECLRERETRMRTIFENVVDGIITTNEKGIIESFNRAAENMFGYPASEIIGRNVSILTPAAHQCRHQKYISEYIKGHDSQIIGTGREVKGVRKDGSDFPIDIAITEMWIGDDRYFCAIMRDITERKKVDRMKNEFISTVSHELRTPLTSIRGALGLVGSGTAGELPEKAQPLVEIASKNCDRLVRLINDILDIEKIEANKMEFALRPIELMQLVNHAVDSNRIYASEYDADIVVSDGASDAIVLVDEDRFIQVLTNLLSNAAKYSPPGGTIGVTMQADNDGVRVSVSDEGPGIPEAFRKRIFEKFSQADSSDTRQKGGSGLGLSITRAIVEGLGGHISFDTQDGDGTTFHVDMPLHSRSAPITDGKPDEQPAAANATARILVCEDDADVSHLLMMMLEANGYHADIARSATDAKAMLSEHEYAAMTLDLLLPDQHGIDLFRDIRKNEKTRELPVIVVSAVASKEAQQLSGNAIQIIDWIDKPIDKNKFICAVARSTKAGSQPMHILHVEDEADVRKIVSSIIGDKYRLSSVTTVAEAKNRLARENFDLVILDLGLPDGSGISLLPIMAHSNPQVPVVLFSAREVDTEIARGVAAALVKSKTSNEILIDTIQNTIAMQPQLAKEA